MAAVGYTAWVLSYILPVEIGTLNGYVSELPARDQPFRWVFGSGDIIAGILVAVVAVILAAGKDGAADRLTRIAWLALAVFGVATVADILFPLDCAPSVSAACRAADHANRVSSPHRIHVVTSVVANVAIVGHIVGVAWLVRCVPGRWRVLERFAVPLAAMTVVSTIVVLALVPVGHGVGVPQRVSVLCVSLWLALLAWDLTVRRRS